ARRAGNWAIDHPAEGGATAGKPPSACAKPSSEISWNISSYPPHEESRRDPCHRIRQMEAIDPECKTSHQLTGFRGDLRSPPRRAAIAPVARYQSIDLARYFRHEN